MLPILHLTRDLAQRVEICSSLVDTEPLRPAAKELVERVFSVSLIRDTCCCHTSFTKDKQFVVHTIFERVPRRDASERMYILFHPGSDAPAAATYKVGGRRVWVSRKEVVIQDVGSMNYTVITIA